MVAIGFSKGWKGLDVYPAFFYSKNLMKKIKRYPTLFSQKQNCHDSSHHFT
jgi:hypothetical protein